MPPHPDLLQFIGQPYAKISPQINQESSVGDCRWWLHQFYETRFGVSLPKAFWSQEIFQDESLIFQTVPQLEYEGDIAIFGPASQSDARLFHLTFYLGEGKLLHANIVDGQVSTWPLAQFLQTPRYAELKRVKRLQLHLFNTQVLPIISKLC